MFLAFILYSVFAICSCYSSVGAKIKRMDFRATLSIRTPQFDPYLYWDLNRFAFSVSF